MSHWADHFYTIDPHGELALRSGYRYVGVMCYVFSQHVKDSVPVYRTLNTQHFYTINLSEFQGSLGNGYAPEMIGWYMFENQTKGGQGTVPLNRWLNEIVGDHCYATAEGEKLVGLVGYKNDGVAGFVLEEQGWSREGIRAVPLYCWYRSTSIDHDDEHRELDDTATVPDDSSTTGTNLIPDTDTGKDMERCGITIDPLFGQVLRDH